MKNIGVFMDGSVKHEGFLNGNKQKYLANSFKSTAKII